MGASGLTDELCEIVGEAHVLTDPAQSAPFVTSWTGRVYGSAHSVVRPNSTAEVSEVVRALTPGCRSFLRVATPDSWEVASPAAARS